MVDMPLVEGLGDCVTVVVVRGVLAVAITEVLAAEAATGSAVFSVAEAAGPCAIVVAEVGLESSVVGIDINAGDDVVEVVVVELNEVEEEKCGCGGGCCVGVFGVTVGGRCVECCCCCGDSSTDDTEDTGWMVGGIVGTCRGREEVNIDTGSDTGGMEEEEDLRTPCGALSLRVDIALYPPLNPP